MVGSDGGVGVVPPVSAAPARAAWYRTAQSHTFCPYAFGVVAAGPALYRVAASFTDASE